jgi:hypothetical protein
VGQWTDGGKVVRAEQTEISRLRAELARVKMERDNMHKLLAPTES